jgi:hypothetical protein
MNKVAAAFHEPQGLWYHGGALVYGLGGYALGLAGLFSGNPWINAGAVLLLGHAMTICAYLIHECATGPGAELGMRHLLWHVRGHPLQALSPPHG